MHGFEPPGYGSAIYVYASASGFGVKKMTKNL